MKVKSIFSKTAFFTIVIVLFAMFTAKAQNCNANFITAVDTLNCNVHFSNTSTTGLDYYWSFGDGATSTQQHPAHSYSVPGTYLVCLSVNDSNYTCYDSTCKQVIVSCGAGSCQADFTAYPDTISCNVYFSNASTAGLDYYWSFGDGASSTQQNPVHSYSVFGTYLVCLSVNDSNYTCYDSICHSVVVTCSTINSIERNKREMINIIAAPNPFNASTNISYNLEMHSDVFLGIYDMLGNLVDVLVKGRTEAGSHTITWDASGKSKGMYIMRFSVNGENSVQKLVLGD